MSLYSLLHGMNKSAGLLLKVLDLDQPNGKWDTGRFRDIYLNSDGTKIILLTRNGGGNRKDYFPEKIVNHPNYITDYDDDFDCTYACIEFSVPEQFKELVSKLSSGVEPLTLKEKSDKTMAELEKMTPEQLNKDERVKPFKDILEKITDPENKQTEFKI